MPSRQNCVIRVAVEAVAHPLLVEDVVDALTVVAPATKVSAPTVDQIASNLRDIVSRKVASIANEHCDKMPTAWIERIGHGVQR